MNSRSVLKSTRKLKKAKLIIDEYPCPIYNTKLIVIKNPSTSILKKRFGIDDYNTTDTLYASTWGCIKDKKDNTRVMLVVIPRKHSSLEMINTAAHEALHCAGDLLMFRGMNLTEDTHEAYAYLIGWLTECIYKTGMKK